MVYILQVGGRASADYKVLAGVGCDESTVIPGPRVVQRSSLSIGVLGFGVQHNTRSLEEVSVKPNGCSFHSHEYCEYEYFKWIS